MLSEQDKTVGAAESLPRAGPDAACENWSIIPVILLGEVPLFEGERFAC